MIVVFAPGGATDVLARIAADHMSRTLGQRVLVENVTGAGGTVGGARGAQAAPDGYTLTVGSMGSHSAAPTIYASSIKYNPLELEPIRTDLEHSLPALKSSRQLLVAVPASLEEHPRVVELVRGEERNRLDTCLVRYVIDNDDTNPHTIGIRFLLDTWINWGWPMPPSNASILA